MEPSLTVGLMPRTRQILGSQVRCASSGANSLSRFALNQKPAQQAIRTLAAGEWSEPAESIVHIQRSLRSWRQNLSPADAGSELFSILVSPGSLRSPEANSLSRFALSSRVSTLSRFALNQWLSSLLRWALNQACAAGGQNCSRWRVERACGSAVKTYRSLRSWRQS